MTLFYLFFSVAGPAILWLIFGGPDLRNSANMLFFMITVLHIYVLIWQRKVFQWLGGDYYTYGSVNFAINLLSLFFTVIFFKQIFHNSRVFEWLFGRSYFRDIFDVPKTLIGIALAGLLVTITLAVFTSKHLVPLPRKSERRSFQPPGEGGI